MQKLGLSVALIMLTGMMSSAATLEEARALWLKGNYREALETYDKIKVGDAAAIALGKHHCARAEGDYDNAEKLLTEALKPSPQHSGLLAAKADLHLLHGRWEQAATTAEQALERDANHLLARWVRARVYAFTGRNEEASKAYEWFILHYNEKQPSDADSLYWIARGATEFALRNKAHNELDFVLNELLQDASKADENFWQAHWYAGALLLEKYNQAEGIPALKNALRINPSSAEALTSLGEAAFQDYDFKQGHVFADQALEINPRLTEALRLKADLYIADSRAEEALPWLEKARVVNPSSEETLGRLAAYHHLTRAPAKADELEKLVSSRNPRPALFHYHLAEILEQRRQFALAEKHFQKAVELAPYLSGAFNGLGMLYMRLGKEEEARKIIEQARDLDPYHVRVLNMKKVLDHLKDYKVIRSPHYEVYVHPKSDTLLGEYMSEYLEATHADLCKRFGYEPPERTKIEILVDHKWFSARVVGLPSIGTVGACTGNVVALASPRSLKSPYNWARVLTHEVTHIITLQQTNYNIPHWYTEALAVQSEGYPRPQIWNQTLAERVPKGELFNLDNINHAFARPKTPLDWQMAYCQSLLYLEYLIEKHGDSAVAGLLNAYRAGDSTEEALKKVCKVSKADFEKGYRGYLEKLVAGLKTFPERKPLSFADAERAHRGKPNNPDLAADLALHHLNRKNHRTARDLARAALAKQPKHALALYILARMEQSIGKTDEALNLLQPAYDENAPEPRVLELLAGLRLQRKEYDQAAKLYGIGNERDPYNSKWLEGLARVYLLQKDDAQLAGALAKLSRMDADSLNVRKKLADLALKAKEWAKAEEWARSALEIQVGDSRIHLVYGEAAMGRKNYPIAIREFRAAWTLEPKDLQCAVRLVEALRAAGDIAQAKAELRAILDKDADHPRAKQLQQELNKP